MSNATGPTPYICVIGGSNIDITGYPHDALHLGDSNPGIVKSALGGVGRNIAENLTRMGIQTVLLSVVGNDAHGTKILAHAKEIGLDMADTLIAAVPTSTFLSVLDEAGEMHIGIAHMDILHNMDLSYIQKVAPRIRNATYCVVDTNLPEILAYLLKHFRVPFVLDTVSASKAVKAKHLIGYCHTVKANKLEAEVLSGISIRSRRDLPKVGRYFMERGVQESFVTMGSKGVYYKTRQEEGILSSATVGMRSASGAGDAFVAGLVHGLSVGKKTVEKVKFAMCASLMTLQSEETIYPDISSEQIEMLLRQTIFTHQIL